MSKQLKKIAIIFFALLFGAGIIFFSINGGALFGEKISFEKKDGVYVGDDSWKNSLKVVSPGAAEKVLGAGAESVTDLPKATTTTELIARELVVRYAKAQISKGGTPLDSTEMEAITRTLSEKTGSSDDIKEYSENDFVLVTTSTSTIETYKKELTAVLNAFGKKKIENELSIVAAAVYSKDSSKLAPLAGNIANIQKFIKDLLALNVPRSVATFHISMVQGYANILSGVIDMQQAMDDPIRGMRGVAKYNNGLGLIDKAVAMLRTS